MKPWRPIWKGLEGAIKDLLEENSRFDVPEVWPLEKWVSKLTWTQLTVADDDCFRISQWLSDSGEHDNSNSFYPVFGGDHHRLQLYLRCLCALDFCRGRFGRRKEFDWHQDTGEIYRKLLIETWRREALHWIHRCDPEVPEVNEFETLLALEVSGLENVRDLN